MRYQSADRFTGSLQDFAEQADIFGLDNGQPVWDRSSNAVLYWFSSASTNLSTADVSVSFRSTMSGVG